jgi:hypothetical protein
MFTPSRRYKADYDGKQGDPYVRAKGKSKSQLDFASRFVGCLWQLLPPFNATTYTAWVLLLHMPTLVFSPPIFCDMLCSNDRCLVSTHQEMFKDYDRKRDVR